MTIPLPELTALLVAATALVAAIAGLYVQVHATHQLVNSRMTELLEATTAVARAAGQQEVSPPPDKPTYPPGQLRAP